MKKITLIALCLLGVKVSFAQNGQGSSLSGTVTGNVEIRTQYYADDTGINAQVPPERLGLNAFANVNYTLWKFTAGIRFESYLPVLLGYPNRFEGTGIGYRFIQFDDKNISVTAGTFYEQFGSGLILRAYEDRNLGIDNAIDGFRIKYTPYKGINLKGVYGKQRFRFQGEIIKGEGVVRGLDGEILFNQMIPKLAETKWRIELGGSFVSKYQADKNPNLILPENVGSYGGRMTLGYAGFNFTGEYIHKENDPSFDNDYRNEYKYIYKNGDGIYLTASYSRKGLGINIQAKSLSNMSFRSDRDAINTDLMISYLPALTKTHTYALASSIYPYATVPYGEVSFQGDIIYTIPKKTKLGGKYGMTISANYSVNFDINRYDLNDLDGARRGYTTKPFDAKWDSLFYQDFNIEIKKKINKTFKFNVNYFFFQFNPIANKVTEYQKLITSHVAVLDMTFRLKKKIYLRTELQGLWTHKDVDDPTKRQDQGHWVAALLELTFSPHWTLSGLWQWNYGNDDPEIRQNHYIMGSFSYIKNGMRFSIDVGRQRAGFFCAGGICRLVPASTGVTFTFTASF